MTGDSIARGLSLRHVRDGEWTGRCPCCNYKSGFTVSQREGITLFRCAAGGCTQNDLINALRRLGLWERASTRKGTYSKTSRAKTLSPPRDDRAANTVGTGAVALKIWRRSVPIGGTPAEIYLRYRGYYGPLPSNLRFAQCRDGKDGPTYPTLIAPVCLAGDLSQGAAIHRTFLAPDGRGKADVIEPKKSLGPIAGGCIPLFPAGPELVIGEGIETTLSVVQALELPGWAAVAGGNLPKIQLPLDVLRVIIAVDPDPVGLKKSHIAARRWTLEGRKVRLLIPPEGRGDWNDICRGIT